MNARVLRDSRNNSSGIYQKSFSNDFLEIRDE